MPSRSDRVADLRAVNGGWKAPWNPQGTMAPYNLNYYGVDSVNYSANHPDWRERIKNGVNCSTSMNGQVHAGMRGGYGHARTRVLGGYESWAVGEILLSATPNPYTLPLPPVHLYERARTQAEIAFSKQFNKRATQWQSGVFAGELLEAARMLANPAKHLRKGIDTLHKEMKDTVQRIARGKSLDAKTRSSRAMRQALAGSWLEWNFGVKPLIQDLDDAARSFRALASGRTFDSIRMVGSGSAEESVSSTVGWSPGTVGWVSIGGWKCPVETVYSVSCDLRGAWKSDRADGFMPLPYNFGLGVKDFVPTAWELLPYSWLVDYFTNIGDVLGAWSMRFVNFSWLNLTTRNETICTVSPPVGPITVFNGGWERWDMEAVCKASRVVRRTVHRAPYTNDWAPQIYGEIPGFGGDYRKWLNISGLLAMRL